ncbi:MAG: hypothetical protein QM767_15935 [Anaeromyxobacter sp.]
MAVQGGEAPRLDLCQALLVRDAAAAEQAFAALIVERGQELQKQKRAGLDADSLYLPFSRVYTEGLAWLALLDEARIGIAGELDYCPQAARAAVYAPFVPGPFPSEPLPGS